MFFQSFLYVFLHSLLTELLSPIPGVEYTAIQPKQDQPTQLQRIGLHGAATSTCQSIKAKNKIQYKYMDWNGVTVFKYVIWWLQNLIIMGSINPKSVHAQMGPVYSHKRRLIPNMQTV